MVMVYGIVIHTTTSVFVNSAFSREEVGRVNYSLIKNNVFGDLTDEVGNPTNDYVYLLSRSECATFLPMEKYRLISPTDFAMSCYAYVETDMGGTIYAPNGGTAVIYLRSVGVDQQWVCDSNSYGGLGSNYGYFANRSFCPAIQLVI